MPYLLDTDTCIWVLRGRDATLSRVRSCAPEDIAIAAISEAELRYGARNSRDPAAGYARIEAFLSAPIDVLPFDRDAAHWHAELRWALRSKPIGERDLMIASIAMAQQRTVVTGNRAEFSRVPGLVVEDWTG